MIACGCKRTLLMELRLIIEGEGFDPRRPLTIDRSCHTDCTAEPCFCYSLVAGLGLIMANRLV
jgi:hypothetical protein